MTSLDDQNNDMFEDDGTSRVLGSYVPLTSGQDSPPAADDGVAGADSDDSGAAAAPVAGAASQAASSNLADPVSGLNGGLLDEAPAEEQPAEPDSWGDEDTNDDAASVEIEAPGARAPAISSGAAAPAITASLASASDAPGSAAMTIDAPGLAGLAAPQANDVDAPVNIAEPDPGNLPVAGGNPAAPGPAATLQTLSTYLNERGTGSGGSDFWDEFWSPMNSPFFNLGTTGTRAKSGVIHYNLTSFPGVDSNGTLAARHGVIRDALNVYEDILGINFVETTSTDTNIVDLFFYDNASGAFANWNNVAAGGEVNYGYVNVNTGWQGGIAGAVGDYVFQTYLHEIGHTLGLGHQGLYNAGAGSPTYNDAYWVNDTWQQTIMSYWGQNNYNGQSYALLLSPMAVDWLTLDRLYNPFGFGIDDGATTGNTTWGFNDSWFAHNNANEPVFGYANNAYNAFSTMLDTNAASIVDGGGIDTLDLSGFSNNSVIDMRVASASSTSGSISSVAGLIGNLTLAVGTVIENIIGGAAGETIWGNGSANNIQGGGGNDTIHGQGGADTLLGQAGNDVIYADSASGASVDGGDGNDWIEGGLNGQTLIGGDGDDSIFGDDASPASGVADSIRGGAGNDYVLGATAGDTIYGDSGNDSLRGGGGGDTIYGDSGNDTLRGEDGDDVLWPNSGLEAGEIYDGGAGNDTLNFSNFGGSYVANLSTGVYSTGATATTLIAVENVLAGSGNDTLIGDGSANLLDGGAGNDSLQGDGGIDTLLGGDGNDTIYPGSGGISSGGEVFDGGNGTDLLEFSGYFSSYRVDLAAGQFDLIAGGFLASLLNFENVNAGNGHDSITGSSGDNVLNGGAGDDTIVGGGGFDTLLGGDGNDVLQGGFTTDSVDGGAGNDLIQVLAGEYYDNVDGGTGDDTLDHAASTYVGSTFDFLAGQITGTGINGASASLAGIEHYMDGSGANTIVWYNVFGGTVDAGAGNDTVHSGLNASETLDGGAGTDTLNTSSYGSNYAVNLATGVTNFAGESFINFENLISGAGNDTLTGTAGANLIDGGAGNDTIDDGAGGDTVIGGAGDDLLIAGDSSFGSGDSWDGGTGNDTLSFQNFSWGTPFPTVIFNLAAGTAFSNGFTETFTSIENFIGSDGDESITGSAGANELRGLDGADTVVGGSGNDTLLGGAGDDQISGSFGSNGSGIVNSDTLDGGTGHDSLWGSDGNDSLLGQAGWDVLRGNGGNDTVNGGVGTDRADYYAATGAVTVDLAAGTASGSDGSDTLTSIEDIGGSNGFGDLLSGDWNDNRIWGYDGNDTLNGLAGNDKLFGGNGNDVLMGGTGINGGGAVNNDLLFGGNGNDTIYGSDGNDTLNGFAGDDILFGNAGDDTIWGAAGDDTLSYQYAASAVTVSLATNTASGGDGNDTFGGIENVDGSAAGDLLTGNTGNNQLDGLAGNDTIFGGGGDDTITGGAGNDQLTGDAGNDRFIFANGFGDDTIFGFSSGDLEKISLAAVSAITDFTDLVNNHLLNVAGTAVIDDGSGNTIVLNGVAFSDVGVGQLYSANDFAFV